MSITGGGHVMSYIIREIKTNYKYEIIIYNVKWTDGRKYSDRRANKKIVLVLYHVQNISEKKRDGIYNEFNLNGYTKYFSRMDSDCNKLFIERSDVPICIFCDFFKF